MRCKFIAKSTTGTQYIAMRFSGVTYEDSTLGCISCLNQRAGPSLREQFPQHRMRHPPVEDDGTLYALLNRINASFNLRDHTSADPASIDASLDLTDGHFWNKPTIGTEHAWHVGQHEHSFRSQSTSNGTSDRISIDVVGLAIRTNTNRRDNWYNIRSNQQFQNSGIYAFRFTDKTKIKHLLNVTGGVAVGSCQPSGSHQTTILAGYTNSDDAGPGDTFGNLLIDGACQNHLDNVEHLSIGDAKPLHEGGLHIQPLQHGIDLRPSAVNHNWVDSNLLQQCDVASEAQRCLFLPHSVAAILNDDDLVVVALQIGQCASEALHGIRGVGHDDCFRGLAFARPYGSMSGGSSRHAPSQGGIFGRNTLTGSPP